MGIQLSFGRIRRIRSQTNVIPYKGGRGNQPSGCPAGQGVFPRLGKYDFSRSEKTLETVGF